MKRLIYSMLALMLALLPQATWAQVFYVELGVNNSTEESPKVFTDANATYDLIFHYDAALSTKPADDIF